MVESSQAWEKLKKYRKFLTRQQAKTIKGQILHGDEEAAVKGLAKIVRRRESGEA